MKEDLLGQWIGRSISVSDEITIVPARSLAMTLNRQIVPEKQGDILPDLWHWLYFLTLCRQDEIGVDGHPERGGFMPPVPLPRRMWAGSRLEFHRPLQLGQTVQKKSSILDVKYKKGRTGSLIFVKVHHQLTTEEGIALTEEQDIVYREMPSADEPPVKPQEAPTDYQWSMMIRPDPVLLFRYSALTLNGHRIHYDRDYAVSQERYPGLVVHGPLIATFLLELLKKKMPEAVIRKFSFKAIRPTFDLEDFSVHGKLEHDGKHVKLWAKDADGWLTMDAIVELIK